MVNGEQFLAALAHLSLRSEEVFRGCFVADFGLGGHVAKTIKSVGFGFRSAADQAATFSRHSFAGMIDHRFEMFAPQLNWWHFKKFEFRISNFEIC